jgi:hypothetical protein
MSHLAMDDGRRQGLFLQGETFDDLQQSVRQLPLAPVAALLAGEPDAPFTAVQTHPAAGRAKEDTLLTGQHADFAIRAASGLRGRISCAMNDNGGSDWRRFQGRHSMSESSYWAPVALRDQTERLGPVVMSCRDRSEKERMEAMGQNMIAYYYFIPLVLPLILFGFFTLALDKFGIKISQLGMRIIGGVFYAIFLEGWFWELFRRPGKPSLVLHERGFRYRKTIALFGELTSVRLGRELSSSETALVAVNRLIGRIKPAHAAAASLMERASETSVTLVFKTGEKKLLYAMLNRPQPEDLSQFFERLTAMHPSLVQ